ncbi:MAG: IS1634 family transposase [Candidatus Omnitrophica bacterium]|nr:IS1634 family transposase [Candidatus Omnitrophota bacterium]
MAHITKKKNRGITYYYAEQREWVDGKSKRKWQKYLGTAENIISAFEHRDLKPEYAVLFELGSIAAFVHVSESIKLKECINTMLPKKQQGLGIGEYLEIAAFNRGTCATSKNAMWDWFEDTVLINYYPHIKKGSLSSQRFWDNMNKINEVDIPKIWMGIIDSAIKTHQIELDQVCYDATNYYTFIGSFNQKCTLAQRGKNKQGRNNLRQVNYALFCCNQDRIPLYFDTYEGNTQDSPEFNKIFREFRQVYAGKLDGSKPVTVIFDKGNNSPENIGQFDGEKLRFVGSVKLGEHKELAIIPNNDSRFVASGHPDLEQIKTYRTIKHIYSKELTVVVTFNSNLHEDQYQTILNDIARCKETLAGLKQRLDDRANGLITKGKKPTMDTVKNHVNEILARPYMKTLIDICYTLKNGLPTLNYTLDLNDLAILSNTYLGKNIIVTDNHEWKTDDIVIAYHSQYQVEHAFRDSKSRKNGSWWPMYHYTDQKIKVHGLYCTITMLLQALIQRKIKQANVKLSMERLFKELSEIKEVINYYPNKNKTNKVRNKNSTVTKMDEVKQKLFDLFEMIKYTIS